MYIYFLDGLWLVVTVSGVGEWYEIWICFAKKNSKVSSLQYLQWFDSLNGVFGIAFNYYNQIKSECRDMTSTKLVYFLTSVIPIFLMISDPVKENWSFVYK